MRARIICLCIGLLLCVIAMMAISLFYIPMPSPEKILARLREDNSYGVAVINNDGNVFRLKAFYPFILTPLCRSYLIVLRDDGAWVSVSFIEKTKGFVYDQFMLFGRECMRVSAIMDVSCLSEMMIDPVVLQSGIITCSQDN